MKRFSNIETTPTGFTGNMALRAGGECYKFSASFHLFLIREAWERGCTHIERYADGFGPGMGTMGGDWSGIRDSSPEAVNRMTEAALNFLFPKEAA